MTAMIAASVAASSPRDPADADGARRDGFILVAVLWILAALATLATVYAVYISSTATAAAVRDDGLLAHGLATAAVEIAALRLVAVPKDKRPSSGEVAFRMGKASVSATFVGEAARIDLNAAPKDLLAGLFTALGAPAEAAADFADRILGFRTPSSGDGGREVALYRDAGLDYGPRGAPFVHVEEIWRVVGLPPALVEQALPHLTVFSGRGEINAADADPVVRAALPGAAPPDAIGGEGAQGAPAVLPGTVREASDAVRVRIRMAFDNGRHRAAEAVILLRDFGDDPYRVLSWREDIDLPAETPPPRPKAERRP
ncbi:general secretion pathway protein GspK [Xanthobacter oligotrophicus]|uniref:general secretion pathway protein GspK n=1 Tax=Xanthobacter oligotrophicus TaxID=2607286 RepID=UPI001E367E5F|nr:type II secretion system protein GspK [Xanthobacter oligotrophicus]MCG5234870.1 type II secretion system protein GspK [Xanthobacter oligotrophicus]